ncbi:MAG: hypothetical protein JXQ72_16740, partial [Anaerolineae bacterium]|nr:hypothetical protein [Anaerolineae bacterium]
APPPTPVSWQGILVGSIGLRFDMPQGWTRMMSDELTDVDQGFAAILLYSNPADADTPDDDPTAPAIAMIRMTGEMAMMLGDSPESLLSTFGEIAEDDITAYNAARYPAARAVLPAGTLSTDTESVMYVLNLGEADWLLVISIVPTGSGDNILLLDETVLQPLIRSIEALAF